MSLNYRRIRRSEQNDLINLCKSDKHWKKYFVEHDLWLEKAFKDIESQDRVVIGAFDTIHDDGNSEKKLVSCLFLKLSPFDNRIEFKNLILQSYDLDQNLSKIEEVKKLIENAIRFCEVRNILKIEIELPQEEHIIISLFLKLGFKAVALRERYSIGNQVCILERSLGDTYYGDPFDMLKLSNWLLRCYMPCEILESEVSVDNLIEIEFKGKALTNAFSSNNSIGNKKLIRGKMLVSEFQENVAEDIKCVLKKAQNHQLTILLTNYNLNDNIKLQLHKKGIIYFDKSDVLAISGGRKSALNIYVKPQDIGGIVTVLEQEQIIEYAKKDTLTYYLLSGLHYGIDLPEYDEEEEDNDPPVILAIYCPSWGDKGGGIVGCSIISECERESIKKILLRKIPEDSALSREDLSFYQTYSEDEIIAVTKSPKIYLFEKPISLNDNIITNSEIKNYLKNELIINSNNSAYLDVTTAQNLINEATLRGYYQEKEIIENEKLKDLPKKKRFKVGLSFPGENRNFIIKIMKVLVKKLGDEAVFYDENFKDELARIDLQPYLGNIYRNECDLIVPFFSKDYEEKSWCQLEWRYIRSILFEKQNTDLIMPFKLDDSNTFGLLRTDGYIYAPDYTAEQCAEFILKRLSKMLPT
jgi:hypothetical protein